MGRIDGFEVRIMIGAPASGKTSWAQAEMLHRFLIVSHDACRRWKVVEHLLLGVEQSFVSDATHPNRERRAPLIAAARAAGARVVACHRTTEFERCAEWNAARSEVLRVPIEGLRRYFSLFEEPTESEGFDEIVRR